MSIITHRQRKALDVLADNHARYPSWVGFSTRHLGTNTAAHLRKMASLGLVQASRGGRGSRQWFSLTEAGRELMKVKWS